jgi:ABC-2 type transport system permease protein
MNNTSIIVRREYLTRIRKTSFIVMTLLGPVLFAAMMILPMWLVSMEDEGIKEIAVLDSSCLFIQKIPETSQYRFTYAADVKLEDFKKNLSRTEYFGVLYIPPHITYIPMGAEFYSYKQPPAGLTMHMANAIEKEIETEKLKAHHIDNLDNILKSVKTNISIRTFKLSEGGGEKESHGYLNMIISYISAFLIYLFIFLFGSQVMRGVIEEKTNRIVEVMISSVKPFQLMAGKVIGIALVGLSQFIIWIVLTFVLVFIAQSVLLSGVAKEALQQAGNMQVIGSLANDQVAVSEMSGKVKDFLSMLQSINFGVLIFGFLFYFIGGYLLYGSLFAAIGSAVDADADTQQFMFPITVPLVAALLVMVNAMQNPDGALAFWFSVIPLTSPVVMMARIPFGVPYGELILSMALLVATFIGAVWLSAKIYRTGILIYGKKLTYKDMWKWLKYK